MASLTAPVSGTLVRVHLIVVGDLIINDISVDIDTAHLLVVSLGRLIEQVAPKEEM